MSDESRDALESSSRDNSFQLHLQLGRAGSNSEQKTPSRKEVSHLLLASGMCGGKVRREGQQAGGRCGCRAACLGGPLPSTSSWSGPAPSSTNQLNVHRAG